MFLLFDGNRFWTQCLFRALAEQHGVGWFELRDWLNALSAGWSLRAGPDARWQGETGRRLWRRRIEMPPGWAHRLRPFTMGYLALQAQSAPLDWDVLVVVYPFYLPLARRLRARRLVYYCLDDYRLYRPARARHVGAEEDELVRLADHTVCISCHRQSDLMRRVPEAQQRIHHIPLGVSEDFLAAESDPSPREMLWQDGPIRRPTVGYVGTLGDRVDWRLVHAVAREAGEWSFVFVGRSPAGPEPSAGGRRPDWFRHFQAAISLPNVRLPGPVPQADVGRANQSFDVCWMPYATDHEFNRASCPTKIMDYLAGGRPVVATPLPECGLHSDVISVVRDPAGMTAALAAALEDTSDRRRNRLSWARDHTWARQAEAFTGLL
jgi:glycosyltransferase involved in cell wall biosynthesis